MKTCSLSLGFHSFDAYGRTSKVDIPNGMDTNYAFDGYGRMTSIEHKDGATVLDGFTYTLDVDGSITRTTHQDNAYWAYEYDGRDRLTKAERYDTDASTLLHRYSYTYDDGDNMLTKEVYDAMATTTTTMAMEYNTANELTKQSVGGTDTTFAYDDWGRTTSKTDGTYSATYAYRYGDKLRSVSSDFPSEGSVSYEYDGAGKRRERTSGGTTTKYRWSEGWSVVCEEDSSGNLTRTCALARPLAKVARMLSDASGPNPSTGTYRYYITDNLGSTRALMAQDKSSLGSYEYTPYGLQYAQSGVPLASLGGAFTGKSWDAAAQMYYFPYRWYSPNAARWLTRDPLGMIDGPNVYAYVRCSPVALRDHLGQLGILGTAVLVGCIVGAVLTLIDSIAQGESATMAACRATFGCFVGGFAGMAALAPILQLGGIVGEVVGGIFGGGIGMAGNEWAKCRCKQIAEQGHW